VIRYSYEFVLSSEQRDNEFQGACFACNQDGDSTKLKKIAGTRSLHGKNRIASKRALPKAIEDLGEKW
jgi:hypothetical protein